MKEKRRKDTFWNRTLMLAVMLGFTFIFFAAGCAAGELAELVTGNAVEIAGWGGLFGLAGFFASVLVLMR